MQVLEDRVEPLGTKSGTEKSPEKLKEIWKKG
jgi:hypothetical protein